VLRIPRPFDGTAHGRTSGSGTPGGQLSAMSAGG
jgi:hypothetical protein